jgi:hypothetical protein
MRLLVMPSANGTHATNKKRIVDPAPQNKLVPKMLKRAFGIDSSVFTEPPKPRKITGTEYRSSPRAALMRGINRLTAAAAP